MHTAGCYDKVGAKEPLGILVLQVTGEVGSCLLVLAGLGLAAAALQVLPGIQGSAALSLCISDAV